MVETGEGRDRCSQNSREGRNQNKGSGNGETDPHGRTACHCCIHSYKQRSPPPSSHHDKHALGTGMLCGEAPSPRWHAVHGRKALLEYLPDRRDSPPAGWVRLYAAAPRPVWIAHLGRHAAVLEGVCAAVTQPRQRAPVSCHGNCRTPVVRRQSPEKLFGHAFQTVVAIPIAQIEYID